MSFEIVTYNVLATAYLDRGDYSAVPPELLYPDWRIPVLVKHISDLDADLLCLQEVEADVFGALDSGLSPHGYEGRYEPKGHGKPDGCAVFWRTSAFALRAARRLEYHDCENGPIEHSGHVALLLALEHEGRLLGVADTHLRWDKPGTPRAKQVGYRQATELLDACKRFEPACVGWLICGDFNRRPNSEVVSAFREAGYEYAHAGRPHVRSVVANHRAGLIDYIFHTDTLQSRPFDPPEVSDSTVLPAVGQPSDHLALTAEIEWVDE
jgi:mRNA deadenylase 3'-5' endonuclease subunit Ccr4